MIGETSFSECYDSLWPQSLGNCRDRVLSEGGGGPIVDGAVLHRLDNVDATRDPVAHAN